MKYTVTFIISFLFFFVYATTSHALSFSIESYGAQFGTNSWDSGQGNIVQELEERQSWLHTKYGDTIVLSLVNDVASSTLTNSIETWFANDISSLIIEEIAGFASETEFGWYSESDSGVIFDGGDSKTTSAKTVNVPSDNSIGFYIDPNGVIENRMYTEHQKNSHYDYQVAIFQVNSSNQFILGWEDLDLTEGDGGDRDYQDMIVSVTIAPVPEPATMLLFGTGLLGLAGLRLRKKK